MKKSSIVLLGLRLFFYFSVIVLIYIHPGISVAFDRIGIILWLVIIPLVAVIIWFYPKLYMWWTKVAALEPFFLAWVNLRLLLLSRSGEEIAGQSIVLTQFILVWTIVIFLSHSAVIYLCLYPKSRFRIWGESIVFFFGALAALFIVFAVLPPDFVRNTVIEKLVTERVPQRISSSDSDGGLPMRGSGRRTLPRGEGGQGELRGIPEHYWQNGGGEDQRQYMVKIVASDREPVYMGDSLRGQLDPVHGFLLSEQEPLNELSRQRLFVTWFNNDPNYDFGRRRQEVFSLSTLRQKYMPYRPVEIDPTILSEDSGPLRYIHQVTSVTYLGDPLLLVNAQTRPLNSFERVKLAHYLELPLEENDRMEFTVYLDNALDVWYNNREAIINSDRYLQYVFSYGGGGIRAGGNSAGGNTYLETIIALLVNFSDYQYNMNPGSSVSIAEIKYFLFNSKEGDCVEFSNTLALLGRLAGIPSRVVTGYLAAEGLQTPAHIRGLAALRARIPVLQQFPFENLYMVTNLHAHSWTQFYIPDYGWLDFEATSFAIPPEGMGDFNNWDVVIPLFDGNRTFSQVRKFPWQAIGRAVITLAIFALISAYVLRYGRELALYLSAKRGDRTGVRSLYLLLLTRLAADGQPIKPASKTAHEYSELFPKSIEGEDSYFKAFADIYSELRWRQFDEPSEIGERFQLLQKEYRNIIMITRRCGLHHFIKRLFSLRGLAYL